jgi:hypothetical protein
MYSDVAHGIDWSLDGATCGGHKLYLIIIVLFSFLPKYSIIQAFIIHVRAYLLSAHSLPISIFCERVDGKS